MTLIIIIKLSSFDSSSNDVHHHYEITCETIEWMLESGRFIFFEEEVSNPCEGIPTNETDKPMPHRNASCH